MMLKHQKDSQRDTSTEVDAELIHRCIRGEEDAWTHLVNRYERLIFSIALSICRDRDVAADILQQVCLELYQRLDEVRNLSSLTAWVATVSRRKTYSHLRSVRPAESLSDDTPVSASNIFANIERQHELQRALATLSDRNRRLMELLYMSSEGCSYEEISRKLGIPVASIGPTRIRCLKKLKKCMAESHVDSH
jgi:RNA polymerase sigma factor (sigma-70 family)